MSTLFTLNEQVDVFPLASVAVNVTAVVPTPDTVVPAMGDCVIVTAEQLSLAVANDM